MNVDFNHYTGNYSGENYTPAQKYRDERARFLEFLNQINEEYRLLIINKEIDNNLNKLKSLDPELLILFENRTWYDYDNRRSHMHEDSASLLASYIEFLYILKEQYEQIELIKSGELRWLKGYNKFIDLFQIFSRYNIIESNLAKFKNFFSLRDNLYFNSKIFDTVVIFYSLECKGYISDFTIESLIKKGLLFTRDGKRKTNILLKQTQFNNNKSNYNKEVSGSNCDNSVVNAMKEFGINIYAK